MCDNGNDRFVKIKNVTLKDCCIGHEWSRKTKEVLLKGGAAMAMIDL